MATELWAIALVLIDGMFGAFGPIFFKKGADKMNFKDYRSIIFNRDLIIGILIYAISTLIFIPALKGGELSVLYPLVGLSYVWVCVYSVILLKEKMNFIKWLGIFIIIMGVAFIGMGI